MPKIVIVSIFAITLFQSISTRFAFAAACCASGTTLPHIITGPQKISLSSAISYGQVIGDYRPGYSKVYLWPKERKLETQTLLISTSMMSSEFSQFGLQVPIVKKSYQSLGGYSEAKTLLGDVSFSYAYELVKEIEYSLYKPRVFTTFRLIFPTGHSQFESTSRGLSDVSGIGQWGMAAGAALVKVLNQFDMTLFPEYRVYFPKEFFRDDSRFRAAGFQAISLNANMGYFQKSLKLRSGFGLMPQLLEARRVASPTIKLSSEREIFCDTTVSLSYLHSDLVSLHLSYIDQTLVGPVSNTTLSRTLTLRLQKFWD